MIEWNKVTWYSKWLALILFVTLPFLGFYLGTRYAAVKYAAEQAPVVQNGASANGNTPATKSALIVVNAPLPHATIRSPLTIFGRARGAWYFEGVFPITLYDAYGNLLARAQGRAQSAWTTSDYVAFTAQITFTSDTATGTIVFAKDNPSGLPQNNVQLVVPVTFAPSSTAP